MAERLTNTPTEVASELVRTLIQKSGRPDTIYSSVERSIGGHRIGFQMDPFKNSDNEGIVKISSIEEDKRLEFHFDKNGLYFYKDIHYQIGAVGSGYYLQRKNLPSDFRKLSIPLIMWSMNCFLKSRLEPVPREVLEELIVVSSAMKKK